MSLPITAHTALVLSTILGIIAIASISTIAVELGLKAITKARNV